MANPGVGAQESGFAETDAQRFAADSRIVLSRLPGGCGRVSYLSFRFSALGEAVPAAAMQQTDCQPYAASILLYPLRSPQRASGCKALPSCIMAYLPIS